MNLKSKVIESWKNAETPTWSYEETRNECITANHFFEIAHKNPAKIFPEELKSNNDEYIRQWVMGCHFEWLNPRK